MICWKCGKTIPDNVKFCPECGVQMTAIPPVQPMSVPAPAYGRTSSETNSNQNTNGLLKAFVFVVSLVFFLSLFLKPTESSRSGNSSSSSSYSGSSYSSSTSAGSSSQRSSGSSATTGESNALQSAKSYLRVMAFSRSGLIEQLEYEGYSKSEATYAVDNCGADWYEQAAKSAKNYLDIMSFSRSGLIEQLEYEGFTHAQAVYGAEQNGY